MERERENTTKFARVAYHYFRKEVWRRFSNGAHSRQQHSHVFGFNLIIVPDCLDDVPHARDCTALSDGVYQKRPGRK